MAIKLGDALLKIGADKSDLDKSMKEMQDHIQTSMEKLQKSFRVVGVAFTAIGAAGMKMVSDSKEMNAALGQVALTLDTTTRDMRQLALATTDVTFPLKSVISTFELLAKAGVRNTVEMQNSAKAFDALADATGNTAESVADLLLPAFKLFGKEIPTTTAELDKFTWLTKKTLVDLSDFGTLLTRMAPYMDDLNMSMDDAIATLAALGEQGIVGTAATLKLRTAITQAASGTVTLNEALGLTQEEIDNYKAQMNDATGITQKYADVANTQFTILDKLKQKFSEITLGLSSFLEPLEPILTAMTALGPAMIFLSTSVGIATVKWIAHTAALVAHRIAALASAAANAVLGASLGPVGIALAAVGVAATILIPLITLLTGKTKESAQAMSDYEKALMESKIAASLTTEEWSSAIERGYLLEDQVKKIAQSLGTNTQALLNDMQAAGMLQTVMTSATDTGRIYINQLGEQVSNLDAAIQKNEEATSAQRALEESWQDFLRQIQPSVKAFGEYNLTAEDVILYMTKTGESIDDVIKSLKKQGIAANDVKYYLDKLGISAKDVADYVGKSAEAMIRDIEDLTDKAKDAARDRTRADIDAIDDRVWKEKEAHSEIIRMLDEEYDAKLRLLDDETNAAIKQLEKQIDAIEDTEDEEAKLRRDAENEKRKAELEANVANAKTLSEKKKAEEELAEFLVDLEVERLKEERRAQKDALRDRISELRDASNLERDRLRQELEEKKANEEAKLDATLKSLKLEKESLDLALKEQLKRYETDYEAFKDLCEKKLGKVWEFAAEYNRIMSSLLPVPAGEGATLPSVPALPGMQYGGLIPEPTVLTSLRTLRPYAVAGERGPEHVVPAGRMGNQMMTIIYEVDGMRMAEILMPYAVGITRIRQGLR